MAIVGTYRCTAYVHERWANKIRSTPKKGSSSRLDVFWEKLKKTILLKILK